MSLLPVPREVFDFHQEGGTSHVRLEMLIDVPFSLALEHTAQVFSALEAEGGIRLPHRVLMHSFRQPDVTESGRHHEEIAFDWVAKSSILPNLSGVLRFRIEYEKTRVIVVGEYVPPFGWIGMLFDRIVGRHIAEASMVELVHRLARILEERRGAFERGQ